MSRLTELRSRGGVAAAIALLAACGGTIDSRQNPEKGSTASGTSSGGQGATQTSSGSASSGSTGGGPVTPIGSSSGGSSSGASSGSSGSSGGSIAGDNGAPGSEGGSGATRGCGLGTSCIPGDLAAPSAADGFQIVTPPGMYTLQPGQEIFPNYCAVVPGTTEFDAGRIQSWMTPGSSHDLAVYRGGMAPADGSCVLGADDMIFMASISEEIVELKMPEGVGNALQPGTQIIVSMHFANNGTSPLQPQVKLNFFRAATYKYEAGMIVSFNTGIDVPGGTPTAPGIQTVNGTCTGSAGSQFFAIGTHMHAHGTTADVDYVNGATTNVVHTTNWAYPDVGVWPATPFLTLQNGDSLDYSCSYSNPGASPITLGESQSNEQCMMVAHYFPATTGASCD